MSIHFTSLNTVDGFKAFLIAYHEQLVAQRSFPPLGLQKALHTAAPAFDYDNWNQMAADLAALSPHTKDGAPVNPELLTVAEALREYIDAIPDDIQFDSMPGMDRDWVDETINLARAGQHNPVWDDNPVQFTRLLAEISMAVENQAVSLADVAESMDLEMPEVFELLSRAEHAFEAMRHGEQACVLGEVSLTEPDTRQHVVTVTVITKETDHETVASVETKVVRDWDKAKEYIADLVRAKVWSNDRTAEEILECNGITLPDEDEQAAMDLDSSDELVAWIIDQNEDDELITLISYLDYNLTTVTTDTDWI